MKLKIKAFSFAEAALSMAVIGVIAVLFTMNIVHKLNANNFRKKDNNSLIRKTVDESNYANRIRGLISTKEFTYTDLAIAPPQKLRIRPVYIQRNYCQEVQFTSDTAAHRLTLTVDGTNYNVEFASTDFSKIPSTNVFDVILTEDNVSDILSQNTVFPPGIKNEYPELFYYIKKSLVDKNITTFLKDLHGRTHLSCSTIELDKEKAGNDAAGTPISVGTPIEVNISPTNGLNNNESRLFIKVYNKDYKKQQN